MKVYKKALVGEARLWLGHGDPGHPDVRPSAVGPHGAIGTNVVNPGDFIVYNAKGYVISVVSSERFDEEYVMDTEERPTCGCKGTGCPECCAHLKPKDDIAEPHWRVGRTLGRTLYKDGMCVGMMDSYEDAKHLVDAANVKFDPQLEKENEELRDQNRSLRAENTSLAMENETHKAGRARACVGRRAAPASLQANDRRRHLQPSRGGTWSPRSRDRTAGGKMKCISENGTPGEVCGHDISIHSSVAGAHARGCGCTHFTAFGLSGETEAMRNAHFDSIPRCKHDQRGGEQFCILCLRSIGDKADLALAKLTREYEEFKCEIFAAIEGGLGVMCADPVKAIRTRRIEMTSHHLEHHAREDFLAAAIVSLEKEKAELDDQFEIDFCCPRCESDCFGTKDPTEPDVSKWVGYCRNCSFEWPRRADDWKYFVRVLRRGYDTKEEFDKEGRTP